LSLILIKIYKLSLINLTYKSNLIWYIDVAEELLPILLVFLPCIRRQQSLYSTSWEFQI